MSILKFRNYKIVRSEKVNEKNGVICLVPMFPSWVMVLKLSEKVHFFQFCADFSKNLGLLDQFTCICIWKVSLRTFRNIWKREENYPMTYCFGGIKISKPSFLLSFCWVSIFFGILIIAKISWTVFQTTINHIIFWKSVMKTFICIYVNCFNRLTFLGEASTKLQKNALFWTT